MSERSSPLTQRVRRILATEHPNAEPQHRHSSAALLRPAQLRHSDAQLAFDGRLARLNGIIEELRQADRQRDAEIGVLREQLRLSREVARREVALDLLPLLSEVDVLIALARTLLDPPPPPPPTTLFERMCARVGAAKPPEQPPAALMAWLNTLLLLRSRLVTMIEASNVEWQDSRL